MKILYHHRTLGDGAEGIHIRDMVAAFRALEHEVMVVGPVGETKPELNQRVGLLTRLKKGMPCILFEVCEIAYTIYSAFQIFRLIKKNRPDFIYDRYITFNAGCILAAKINKVPILVEVNAPLALERSQEPDEKLIFRKLAFFIESWVCKHANRTIVVSTPLKEYLISVGVPQEKIIVMPNGVNDKKFIPAPKSQELLDELGIGRDDVTIGFTGVLRPWHGVDILVRSVAELSKEKNIFLLIVGDGPIRQEIEQLIKETGLEGKAAITGRVDHEKVPQYVNLIDIAVSPKTTFYASPMKVIEYMSMGKAVVAPDTKNLLDIIDPEVNGKVFLVDDFYSLRDVLASLSENGCFRNSLGASAREKVNRRLNWGWNASEVCRIVSDL
ncbi:glycosyltransferase family 4 protein [Desulfuromonas sp. TF]|uniref:glycosyltransferase family 4 protein n=1 Tax=Desulfuromonas sp. TF TaxID=1232410 RepID=UPI0003F51482|nr:glycosyltransferase family 4 protein [Desulfuromonas sp. TF]